jgi:predicted helicase
MDATERAERLAWLSKEDNPNQCRILTNARCLAEGVDVPSLDAAIFFAPKKSKVDVVQAVGRVMRTFTNEKTGEKKKLGYIILPVVIPDGMSPAEALSYSKTFDIVWSVLQALRSHDERIDAYVNSLPYRKTKDKEKNRGGAGSDGTSVIGHDGQLEGPDANKNQMSMVDFGSTELERAVYAEAVDRCGTKIYWNSWADDVAKIAKRYIKQINDAIKNDPKARKSFDSFIESLRASLNSSIDEKDAIEMVAQHMITLPVFDALFGDYDFAKSNPVSIAIQTFVESLQDHGVGDISDASKQQLDSLYTSVRRRAIFCRTDSNRQKLIKDLYSEFFSKAFSKTSENLGIVYTPLEIVDYMLHATDRAMKREFGRGLADRGVHILDPFAGTGSFLAELISDPTLIPLNKLPNKYLHELHNNELILLAYYIMVVNIEYAYHERTGEEYVPFPGAVLTDTFQMDEKDDKINVDVFIDNSERMLEQQEVPIKVIVGNPPYSIGQKSANDNNANESYPRLEERIKESYSSHTKAVNKNSLMDSYIEALRWASDRIGNEGIICFVSNAGWLRSTVGAGIRRCFSEEFNSIYVFDFLGRIQYRKMTRDQLKKQGENVFGSGSTAAIAITMLVKNPHSSKKDVIHYHSVGEYKTRGQKLAAVASYIESEPSWEILTQDKYGDWLDKRDDSFYKLAPMGLEKKKGSLGIWKIWSNGVKTQRDSWVWNYSETSVADNVHFLIENTNSKIAQIKGDISSLTSGSINTQKYSWTVAMREYAKKQLVIPFSSDFIVLSQYRPFCKQWLYFEPHLNERAYQQPKLFPLIAPHKTAENTVIDIGIQGASIADMLPDLEFSQHGQCFPLYWYEKDDKDKGRQVLRTSEKVIVDAWGNRYIRHDAIP